MDLTIDDVATLLNVSENTIKRWVSNGEIPYYLLHKQYRFSRDEVENWMFSRKQEALAPAKKEMSREKLGTQQFGLFRAIHKGGVWVDVPGKTKEEVIRNAMKQIAGELHLDAEVITELLLDRENLMPTALSNGVGVPHTRDFLLQEAYDVIAVVFPKKPIEYGALDGAPVHTLFFLFACDDKRHLHLLAKLAHLSSKPENLAFFKTHPDKVQLLEYVKTWESNLRGVKD